VEVLNEDVELWVADSYRALAQELRVISNSQGPCIEDGSHLNARSAAKTQLLHRWRDRLHMAERELVAIQGRENWLYWLLRRLPFYANELRLTSTESVGPVIEEFRRNVETPNGRSAEVFDPTRFSLETFVEEVKQSPLV
jgi:hypothetical protein